MRLDVFTQIPHAFGWLTEHKPVATVLGGELELRLFNYRETTPLRGGQVDDSPYGGGAGMVLRVDVVAAALDAVYGGAPGHRVAALSPQGRRLTQEVVEELAKEEHLTLLSARSKVSQTMRSPSASRRQWRYICPSCAMGHPLAALDQHGEHSERLLLQVLAKSALRQCAGPKIGLEGSKPKASRRGRDLHSKPESFSSSSTIAFS